ncbi:MAG: hypothetical protein NZX11_02915, partial [Thermus sp.]|nr:hypothetical protein [Thermus sp.]
MPLPLRFSYIYGGGSGERVLASAPAPQGAEVPGALYREGGNTFYLSAIALYAQGPTGRAEALAVVGANPPKGSCLGSPSGGSSAREGDLVVNITGPDPFFNGVYASATSKVRVTTPTGTTSFPTTGTHRVTLRLGPSESATLNAPLITATEAVAGQNLTYLYGPPLNQSIPASALGPFTPTSVDVVYQILPGRVAYRVANPPGAGGSLGPVSCTAQGRYAQCPSSSLGETSTSFPPGVYTFGFSPWRVNRQGTLDGQTLAYTEDYAVRTASPNPVPVSSGMDVLVSVTLNATPDPGVLQVTASGLPAGVNPTYSVQNPSGTTVGSGGWALGQNFSLAPGLYRVVATSVSSGGVIYDPSPASAVVAVSSNSTTPHTIPYAVRPATLRVNMTGLPQGQGQILVSGPGYSQNLSGSATLNLTSFGNYTVTAQDVAYGGRTYRATVNPTGFNAVSGGSYTVNVDYAPITILQIRFQNPTGVCTNGTLRVTGPSGFSRFYSADATEMAVPSGSYSASMSTQPSSSLYTCQATVTPSSLALAQGDTGTFTVNVSPTDGILQITLQGYPYA